MRETAYRLAREKELPRYPAPDVPFGVTYLRFESGLHEYYRAIVPGVKLRQYGLCEVALPDEGEAQERVERSQVVVVSRPNQAEDVVFIEAMKEAGKIVLIDTDDYVYLLWGLSERLSDRWDSKHLGYFEKCVRLADGMTVSVPPLRTRMEELGAKRVFTLDNCLDPRSRRWDVSWPEDDGRVRIGWIAGFSHARDAVVLEQPIKRVLKDYPQATFVSVGYMPTWLDQLPPEQLEVRATSNLGGFVEMAVGLDISLGPLADVEFNQYRSTVKMWESTCAGSCFVASDFGPYATLDHKLFRACSTEDDWVAALSELVESAEQRDQLWHRAADRLINKEAIDVSVARYYWAYRKAVVSSDVYRAARKRIELLRGVRY